MAYAFTNNPMTPSKDPISLDGPPPENLVPSGFVESRIRQLNIISSKDRPKIQDSLHVANRSSRRSQANPRASLSTIQTAQQAPHSSTEERKDALDMFDMFGVSRPKGWVSDEREQQQVSQLKTVQCKTELVSTLTTNLPADHIHTQEQQTSEQGTWRQGVTHSQSLGNLSVPLSREGRTSHPLSGSKSRDSITGYPKGSQPERGEIERQARQQFRHERRQRLEKSYSDMINPEQYPGCPTCHTSTNPARHSICCLARHSPSRRHMVDRPNQSEEETMYETGSKDSSKSIYRQNEAEMNVVMATSLSSDYKTAEPFSSQQPEYDALSDGRADTTVSLSQRLHTNTAWTGNDLQISAPQRAHDLADDVTTDAQRAPRSLHSIEDDFSTSTTGPFQRGAIPRNGGQSTSELDLGVELDNMNPANLRGSQAVSKIPAPLQHTPIFRENSSTSECQRVSKYEYEPAKDTEANQQRELLHSPTRKAAGLSPKTLGRGDKETIGSEDSLRKIAVANSTKSPKQNIESSDVSTWKQQLRKVGDTLLSRSNSPKKASSPLTPGSQLHSPQSPIAFLYNEETIASSTRRYEVEIKEQTSGLHKQMESINDNMENIMAESADTEPKITLTAPDEDSEMPISHHICEWRLRYLGLSAAFDKLKSELDIVLQHQANPDTTEQELETASHHDRYNDHGIEGLTIIVHRRCKEDLVLNTDLREEEFTDIGE
ncbi:hypothetical protein GGI43DRAFT_379832 [Trichoderma evansii]